ncbi:MAG: IS1634 family transposase [Bacillota bacterium]
MLKRATKILVLLGAERYFSYDVSPRGRPRLRFSLNQDEIERCSRKDGVFVLRTNVLDLPPEEVVAAYKSLGSIERAFRALKSFVRIRPVYHRKDLRIRAHVFICVLAYLLEKTLEHWMKKNGIARTWPDVLSELETLRWSYIEVGKKKIGKPDRPKPEQIPILEALRIAGEFGRMEVSDRP